MKRIIKKKTTTEKEENNNDDNKEDDKPKKVIKRVIKKKTTTDKEENKDDKEDDNISIKSTISDKSILNTISKIKKITKSEDKIERKSKTKIIDLNEFKISEDYDYRQIKDITDIGKKILNVDKLNHIDIKKKILVYLKDNNKLTNNIEIENIKFSLNNIDKFISAYLVK